MTPPRNKVTSWSIYADLSRALSTGHRRAISSALESMVTRGGCVGAQRGGVDELYFRLDAASPEETAHAARNVLDTVLTKAAVAARYEVQVEPAVGAEFATKSFDTLADELTPPFASDFTDQQTK